MVTTKQKKSDKLLHISSDLIDLKFISCQIIESKIVKLLHNFTDVGTVTVDQVETEIKKMSIQIRTRSFQAFILIIACQCNQFRLSLILKMWGLKFKTLKVALHVQY